jgi:hypothetical protein
MTASASKRSAMTRPLGETPTIGHVNPLLLFAFSSTRLPSPAYPILTELDNPFAGTVQVIPVRDLYPVLPRHHPLIVFEQQRFGFLVLVTRVIHCKLLEARVRIELTNKGFADL